MANLGTYDAGQIVRIRGILHPNLMDPSTLSGRSCPGQALIISLDERLIGQAYYDRAFRGGGFTARIDVDISVRLLPHYEADRSGFRLEPVTIHSFQEIDP